MQPEAVLMTSFACSLSHWKLQSEGCSSRGHRHMQAVCTYHHEIGRGGAKLLQNSLAHKLQY